MQSARLSVLWRLVEAQGLSSLLVFFGYFFSAKLGQYIFLSQHSAPSVFWLPAGIALVSVFLYGYRMALPIALGELAAIATAGHASLLFIVAITIGCTLQPLLGTYLLKRFRFTGSMDTTSQAIAIIIGALIIGLVSPAIAAFTLAIFHPVSALAWADFGRMWAANAIGILTITPLISFWRGSDSRPSLQQLIELSAIFVILGGCLYFIFWTKVAGMLGLPLACAVFATLFWLLLRFEPRFMGIAIAGAFAIAVAGGIVAHPTAPLDNQLFGDELIFVLFAPMFLICAAVAHERRKSARELADQVAKLEILTERLQADDERKNQFIATLAHELRNPLAPVVSTLDILSIRHECDPESVKLIAGAQRQTDSIRRLLNDLLDVGRITHNKLTLAQEMIDLCEIVKHSVQTIEPNLCGRERDLTVSAPSESLWLRVDKVRLEQIIVNLLNNAVKYTEPGEQIELSCVRQGDEAVVCVRDSGRGIAAEDLSEIFLPFRQVTGAPHQRGGLGIGLSITKQLVLLHGGSIEAESPGIGEGSVFTLRLPLA
ncbi:MAG: ATP-binding protein [Minisyncoccia bacterium]